MSEIGEQFQKKERAEELTHGGLVKREGDMVTLGDGSHWWLNGEQWARNSADATIHYDTMNLNHILATPQTHSLKDLARRLLN